MSSAATGTTGATGRPKSGLSSVKPADHNERRPARWRAWLGYALAGVAGAAGAKFSYDFGVQISGVGVGLLLAVNTAVFCAVLVGALADRLLGYRRP